MPTIQDQLNELKRSLEAIRLGIEMLQAQLEDEDNKAEFDAWCNAFDQRWQSATFKDQGSVFHDHTSDCGPLCPDHADPRDTSVLS